MYSLRKINAVCLFQLRQAFSAWKNPGIFLLVGIFVWLNVQQVGDFSKTVDVAVHPWLFAHLTNDFFASLFLPPLA